MAATVAKSGARVFTNWLPFGVRGFFFVAVVPFRERSRLVKLHGVRTLVTTKGVCNYVSQISETGGINFKIQVFS